MSYSFLSIAMSYHLSFSLFTIKVNKKASLSVFLFKIFNGSVKIKKKLSELKILSKSYESSLETKLGFW